jgi:MYXO-CTERM domain-containing protein
MDWLLPRTDAGVALQFAIFVAAALAGIVLVRRRREWLLLVVGLTVFGLGLLGVRAVH